MIERAFKVFVTGMGLIVVGLSGFHLLQLLGSKPQESVSAPTQFNEKPPAEIALQSLREAYKLGHLQGYLDGYRTGVMDTSDKYNNRIKGEGL